jgi:hypothetical protein
LLVRNDPLGVSVSAGWVVATGDVAGDGRRRCEEEAAMLGVSTLVSA